MKFKTTAKAIRAAMTYEKTISINYCGMQHLLWNHAPIAYTCGIYGWNFDVYRVHGVTICTGYRGMPGIDPDYTTLRNYEREAERIVHDSGLSWEEKEQKTEALLKSFCEIYG